MIFKQLFHPETSTFTYILGANNSEAIIIDPVIDDLDKYLALLDELNLKLVYALDTHVHADHITALGELREKTGCVTVMGEPGHAKCASHIVADGEKIVVGDLEITTLQTPGHTDDSFCYVMNDRVFTGDTLLINGTGRTDFQNGDAAEQYNSLFTKLLTMADETLVFPGHDYNGRTVSTIGEEKRNNPRLQVSNEAEYRDIMDNLNLPNPKQMDVAVPANLTCGQN